MTGPRRADRDSGLSLSPVRRRGAAIAPEGYADAEVARGQADAVLGALGRMQLRLDMLAREQSESLEAVLQVLEQVLDRLNELEAEPRESS
jgi:hypothetical protein